MTQTLNLNYNEYKYHVSQENLEYVRHVLDALYGHSDPYPEGVVDSIYFDTSDFKFYEQCRNGESLKRKFRIRGYGDGVFHQLHLKDKDLLTVIKRKQKIQPVQVRDFEMPDWLQIAPEGPDTKQYFAIKSIADQYGILFPIIRVRYRRFRYRIYDYRMTLDTNIEVSGFSNLVDLRNQYAVLPHHVLEIKTFDQRPHLPFLGIFRLPQISFSKFYLGLNLLNTGDINAS